MCDVVAAPHALTIVHIPHASPATYVLCGILRWVPAVCLPSRRDDMRFSRYWSRSHMESVAQVKITVAWSVFGRRHCANGLANALSTHGKTCAGADAATTYDCGGGGGGRRWGRRYWSVRRRASAVRCAGG